MQQNYLNKASEGEIEQLNILLEKYGSKKKIRKGEKLITEGEHCPFFVYVLKGGFKSYVLKNDREYILGFSFSNFIECCPYSLFSKQPSTYTIEAYADSEVIKVSLSDLEKYTLEDNGFDLFVQSALIDYIHVVETTLFDLISKTAEERYEELLLNSPNEIHLISLTELASYLGVTPERLSRIRKKNKVT